MKRPSLMALYEANYRKLDALVDHWPHEAGRVVLAVDAEPQVVLTLAERFPYTSTLEVHLVGPGILERLGARVPTLYVRVYHDAKAAEVRGFRGHWRLRSEYPRPNPDMFAPDEKYQLNRFFSELLDFCRLRGALPTLS